MLILILKFFNVIIKIYRILEDDGLSYDIIVFISGYISERDEENRFVFFDFCDECYLRI